MGAGIDVAPGSNSKREHAVKNCENCKHLEYIEDDSAYPNSGYACNKRGYASDSEERRHLALLDDESYRLKPKKCSESVSEGAK